MNSPFDIRLLMEQVSLFNDEEAYKKIYYHYYKGLQQFVLSFVKKSEVAEEIVSDVFMNLWKNRSRLLEIENLKVYLFVASKNLSIRYICRSHPTYQFSLDGLSVQMASDDQTPEELMISREMITRIETAIQNLPPRCKIIFKLIREDYMSYKEVAQVLDISVKTVDAQMAIASKKISQSLQLKTNVSVR